MDSALHPLQSVPKNMQSAIQHPERSQPDDLFVRDGTVSIRSAISWHQLFWVIPKQSNDYLLSINLSFSETFTAAIFIDVCLNASPPFDALHNCVGVNYVYKYILM